MHIVNVVLRPSFRGCSIGGVWALQFWSVRFADWSIHISKLWYYPDWLLIVGPNILVFDFINKYNKSIFLRRKMKIQFEIHTFWPITMDFILIGLESYLSNQLLCTDHSPFFIGMDIEWWNNYVHQDFPVDIHWISTSS